MSSNIPTPETIETLDIIVQSYGDNTKDRSNYKSTLAQSYVGSIMIDQVHLTPYKLQNNTTSRFELELVLIFTEILKHYPYYVGLQPINIYTSERAIPKLLSRLNTFIDYCISNDGKYNFNTLDIDKHIEYIIFDLCIFDPRIKCINNIKVFLQKFLPMVHSHLLAKHIRFNIQVYKAQTKHKRDDQWKRHWYVANKVRSTTLQYADIQMGLTLEETRNDVQKRRNKWKSTADNQHKK